MKKDISIMSALISTFSCLSSMLKFIVDKDILKNVKVCPSSDYPRAATVVSQSAQPLTTPRSTPRLSVAWWPRLKFSLLPFLTHSRKATAPHTRQPRVPLLTALVPWVRKHQAASASLRSSPPTAECRSSSSGKTCWTTQMPLKT